MIVMKQKLFRKHIFQFIQICMVMFPMTGCDEFLDKEPQAAVPSDEAIINRASAQAAIIGVYANLATGYSQPYTIFPDLLADNLAANGSFVP
jgi:starch-binding outer membrane protein, SusD/RagB family